MSEYAPFKIGEIAIAHKSICGRPEMEVTIVKGLRSIRCTMTDEIYMGYIGLLPDGQRKGFRVYQLRKLPPKDTPTTWEQVEALTGWNPGRVEA